jgi:trk system potassium uptake protein TrkH
MVFSLPWAFLEGDWSMSRERHGFLALTAAITVCLAVGASLRRLGREAHGQLFRKEAMAVVGLSWVLATVLGGLPFWFSGTLRAPDVRMSLVDSMFESQSGFSTTGATVLSELEDPEMVPRCILFWRSSTHYLGGLGIIVLFVAILGQGSAGKALMRAEMPGPSHSTPQARMQHTAWVLFLIYTGLNGALALALWLQKIPLFDSLCHAFGTMATGGFSTYNASVGQFTTDPNLNGTMIEMTIIAFMILAGTNFMLLYWLLIRQPGKLFGDLEWRTYVAVIVGVTAVILAAGLLHGDFDQFGTSDQAIDGGMADGEDPFPVFRGFRYSLFQVVSIMTTTGFCTDEFEKWNALAAGLLVTLMFIGGCAGSTGGGMKVIRHLLFTKVLRLEVEQAFHPSVVRPLRIRGEPVEDQSLRRTILVYFGLVLIIFMASWLFTLGIEPDSTWTAYEHDVDHKLIDSASCVAATLNNIGPGLGVIGARQNYGGFSMPTKILFIWLMMLGRLEIFVILVLFVPSFWRSQ